MQPDPTNKLTPLRPLWLPDWFSAAGRCLMIVLICCLWLFLSPDALAFCGFYVAKADSKLYNQASQVAIARSGERTVLTMANDYQGNVKDFAMVVPVPVVLKKDQIKVAEPKIMERLDAFSAPRLVEYFDSDPCLMGRVGDLEARTAKLETQQFSTNTALQGSVALGVTVEARYNVGEYNILILSAKESGGLETWLVQNGYRVPVGARNLLQPYIRQNMKFFVAKVNLQEFQRGSSQSLRPLQISYESPKFMLPIRLGMVNAKSAQDLLVYILSPNGQAEVTNYRTVKVPSGKEIPTFVKNEFSDFYRAMFQTSYEREDRKVAFLEYAWDMSSCDPCSSEPLNPTELRQAGVFWLDTENPNSGTPPRLTGLSASQFRTTPPSTSPPSPSSPSPAPPILPQQSFSQPRGVFITRLHVRYSRDRFPEDLMFQTTGNREQFQGRYVLRHPFEGNLGCDAGKQYQQDLPRRFEKEAQTLANLTNWDIQDIRNKQKTPRRQSQGGFHWFGT
jgi:hypothetical protein